MSFPSSKVGLISEDVLLITRDVDLADTVTKNPVLEVDETVKVVTETQSYVVWGDGKTAFNDLKQNTIDGGSDPSGNVESVSGDLVDNTDPSNPVINNPTIAQVAGLQAELDGKQPSGDYATSAELTNGLADKLDIADALQIGTTATTAKAGDYQPTWAQVTDKPSTFAPAAHEHPFTEITGTATAGQIPTLAISKISGLQDELDAKLEASQGAAVADSVAEDVATLVADFNALLANLRTAGVIAT